jgi:hypothetical protein
MSRFRDLYGCSACVVSKFLGTYQSLYAFIEAVLRPVRKIIAAPFSPLEDEFKDREQCVMLSQLRLWDGKRLTHKMGQLPDDQFEAVKQALRRLLK